MCFSQDFYRNLFLCEILLYPPPPPPIQKRKNIKHFKMITNLNALTLGNSSKCKFNKNAHI